MPQQIVANARDAGISYRLVSAIVRSPSSLNDQGACKTAKFEHGCHVTNYKTTTLPYMVMHRWPKRGSKRIARQTLLLSPGMSEEGQIKVCSCLSTA